MSDQDQKLPPLAIVGLSLKFPQDAVSPESFWDMLVKGRCASTDFPSDRLNIDAYHNSDTNRLDTLTARGGHFMTEDLGLFDAPFFSITAAEAEAMDPQQRLVLEAAYRALENAGLTMEKIAKSKTCVFAGSTGHDYLMLKVKDSQCLQKWDITGTTSNMVPNRVSWFFDLVGPSAAIDTACSSSLMALDMTCQSIWSGDSSMGLAVGSNILLSLETTLMMDNLGLLSKDSRCQSFDSRGNGYARGEGVGVLVIKPLQDALRDGDTIRSVIRASASNQDGRTPGITQPSPEMQAQLIKETYRKAGLDMAATRYFEAHGTGTAVGDPIEVKAIGSVFRQYRSPDAPLYIGSVKSNIGHLEGGSGVAGVIKTVLALERGIIPPNSTNLQNLNPRIDDEFFNMKFSQASLPWPSEGLRRASVSSFGYGGSKTHIVLDDAFHYLTLNGLSGNHSTDIPHRSTMCKDHTPTDVQDIESAEPGWVSIQKRPENSPKLLVWSIADEKGVSRLQKAWKSWLPPNAKLDDLQNGLLDHLAYTLASRRTLLSWRTFAVSNPSDSWATISDKFSLTSQARISPNMVMIFSGQGAQWFAMGRQLLDVFPVFSQSVEQAGDYLRSLGCDWDPIDELKRSESTSNVNKTEYSQILCTILQVALVDLLRFLNIVPKAVLGHSSGEVAAAYCARGITRQSAWKVSYYRGNMSNTLENTSEFKGSMLAVALSEKDANSYIEAAATQFDSPKLSVGCINSPKSVTVTGEAIQLDALKVLLDRDSIFCRRLKVNLAYHSSQMREISGLYLEALGELTSDYSGNKNCPEMVSSVTGNWIERGETAKASHWVNNMISPVRFSDGLAVLCAGSGSDSHKSLDGSHRRTMSIDHIVEVGPHSVLQGACKDVLKTMQGKRPIEYLSILVRNISAVDTAFSLFGTLFAAGYPIDLMRVNGQDSVKPGTFKCLSDLPAYPFNHDVRYWHESDLSKNHRLQKVGRNDLLGVPDPSCNPFERKWRHFLRVSEMPWIKDHQIDNSILYPGAGMVVMAIEAARQTAEPGRAIEAFNAQEVKFHAAMRVPTGSHGLETNLYLHSVEGMESKSSAWSEFRICTYDNGIWTENCTGIIQTVYAASDTVPVVERRNREELWNSQLESYAAAVAACTLPADGSSLYERLQRSGYGYGEAFQLVKELSFGLQKPDVVADVQQFTSPAGEIIHPTTLDAILQTSIWTSVDPETGDIPTAIPTSIDSLWVSSQLPTKATSASLKTHATRNKESTFLGASFDVTVFDDDLREVLVSVQGLGTNVVSKTESSLNGPVATENICHHFEWKPEPRLLSSDDIMNLCRHTNVSDLPNSGDDSKDLEFLFMSRIIRVLRALHLQGITPSKPHLQKYVNWMKQQQILLTEGHLWLSEDIWKSRLVDADYVREVESRVSSKNSHGSFYTTVATDLLGFLTGSVDPIETLSQSGRMRDLYHEEVGCLQQTRCVANRNQLGESRCIKQFSRYLELLTHSHPRMKFIEIGAGSGSMTDVMIRMLGGADEESDRKYAQWDYTSISNSVFSSAQDRFRQEANKMTFKELDIEKDPEAQGFECGTYDVVVAGLVLHTFSDLKKALCNTRKLLKPGGKLMMYEVVGSGLRSTFLYGLLEGWWSGKLDLPTRMTSKLIVKGSESSRAMGVGPYINKQQWNEHLIQAGFSGLDLVFADSDDSVTDECGMIVTTAIENPSKDHQGMEIEIVYDRAEAAQRDFADHLVNDLKSISMGPIRCSSVQEAVEYHPDSPLLRLVLLELQSPVLCEIEPELFGQLQNLLSSTEHVLWINQGGGIFPSQPQSRLVEGMLRVLRTENIKRRHHLLSLEPQVSLTRRQQDHIIELVRLLLSPAAQNADMEYVEHEGLLNIPRILPSRTLNKDISRMASSHQTAVQDFNCQIPLSLNAASAGLLNGFEFIEDESAYLPLQADEIEVEIRCAGINFRDVLIAVGQLKASHTGSEWSGVVSRVGDACSRFQVGDSVVGLHNGCFSTSVRMLENGPIVKIPAGISFPDAAAVSVNFATSYIALHNVARIQSGETVLIHSASGGTGQAAIQIAKSAGATVFATVGSESKKKLLMDVYNIPESHIFSSRTTLFSKMIKLRTGGKGVDVILNSLAGESLFASWKCIAPYGRFLEIGKRDILSNQRLPMLKFLDNVTFSGVDLAVMSVERPEICTTALKSVFDLIQQGKLHPSQPISVYGVGEMEKAFRIMQTGQHVGKMVLEMRAHDQVKTVLKTRPTFSLDAHATFVVSGGLGGIGRNMICWLADRGARHLLLLSRSGGKTVKARDIIQSLEERGVKVLAPMCDVSNRASVEDALRECRSCMPPIKGCIQAAMVLRDGVFEGISHQSWQESIRPKVQGSLNLHELLPRGMDFFIMLSSVAGILGTTGQANYAAGNTFQDALARHRVRLGEKATSLNLGVIDFAGAVVEDARLHDLWIKKSELPPVTEAHVHGLLSTYCDPRICSATSLECQIVAGLSSEAVSGNDQWRSDPIVQHLVVKENPGGDQNTHSSSKGASSLLQAKSLAEANTLVAELFAHKLSAALGIATGDIDSNKPLHQYGVDSLVAVELRGWFSKEIQADLGVFEIIGGATMTSVAQLAARKSKIVKVAEN
ncbi:unnamed protein product [Penicillium salamii]|nr:unnamed protein product [Penicillium salamii]